MKKSKILLIVSSIFACLIIWQGCQKTEELATLYKDVETMQLKSADGFDCTSNCIDPENPAWFEKTDHQIISWAGLDDDKFSKSIDIVYYNTLTDFVLGVRSTNGIADILVDEESVKNIDETIPADTWHQITFPLAENWQACETWSFELQITGYGPPAYFDVEYALVGLCQQQPGIVVGVQGQLMQITDETFAEYHPRIDGDIVVFTAFSDNSQNIAFVDLGTGERRQITTGPEDQRLQDVSGRRIVYADYSASLPEVFVYGIDTSTESPLGGEAGGRDWPAIDGELVAHVHTASGRLTSIRIADLAASQTVAITSNSNPERAPSISGEFVAFERTVDGDSYVLLHDMRDGSETMLFPGASNQRRPHVNGDRVVFDAFVDGRSVRDLVVYEISTGSLHHLPAEGNQSYHRLSGDWLVFDDDNLSAADIVLMHLPTGFSHRITSPANTDYFSDIDGNRVVFTSNAGGKFDIWMYEFEAIYGNE